MKLRGSLPGAMVKYTTLGRMTFRGAGFRVAVWVTGGGDGQGRFPIWDEGYTPIVPESVCKRLRFNDLVAPFETALPMCVQVASIVIVTRNVA